VEKETLDIAIVQMTSVDSLSANLQKFETVFSKLKPGTVDLVCFPENCLFLRVRESDPIERFDLSHSCFMWLGEWARRLKTTLHLGSVPMVINGKLFNSSVWISEDGLPHLGYQKMHLFDIELEGQKPIRESAIFDRGTTGSIHNLKGWKIAESICYDVRFSELFSEYAYAQTDIILVPAAFLVETGKAHWEILLRARAIESQNYVIASAQVGNHQSTKAQAERQTFGHSMAIDPWGVVQVNLGTTETLELVHLSMERLHKVRRQMPMASHRRGRKGNTV
jgi:predicted amidohydrolase